MKNETNLTVTIRSADGRVSFSLASEGKDYLRCSVRAPEMQCAIKTFLHSDAVALVEFLNSLANVMNPSGERFFSWNIP